MKRRNAERSGVRVVKYPTSITVSVSASDLPLYDDAFLVDDEHFTDEQYAELYDFITQEAARIRFTLKFLEGQAFGL